MDGLQSIKKESPVEAKPRFPPKQPFLRGCPANASATTKDDSKSSNDPSRGTGNQEDTHRGDGNLV